MHMPLEDTLGLNLLAANQHQAEHNHAVSYTHLTLPTSYAV